ncbi:hypothetical protein QBC39DRAFT_264327 [Podospora conica]|nr:hypothetical protein QBC39DRAFT_264327 [Schizothecium conicum]
MSAPKGPPPPEPGYSVGDKLDAIPLGVVGTLLGIASITTALRIYWRARPTWRIGADDYTLIFAWVSQPQSVLTVSWYGIDAAMYHHGRGTMGFVPVMSTMGPLIVADGVLWLWGINVIRISVALMLLRLKDNLSWKCTLWTIIGAQVCMLIVGTTMHLVMCQPISGRWTSDPAAKCIAPDKFMIYGYVYSGFTVASDLILALLPLTFIRSLHRPLHEKVLIGCLMAAGLAATGVAVARLFLIMGYLGKNGLPSINMLSDILWGLELTIGILTASVPTLKAPIHRLLLDCGVLQDKTVTSERSPESFLDQLTQGSHFTRQMRQWDTIRDGDSNRPFMYSTAKKSEGSSSADTRVNDSATREVTTSAV